MRDNDPNDDPTTHDAMILRLIANAAQLGVAMDLIPENWYLSIIHNPRNGEASASASVLPPGDRFSRLRRAAIDHGLDIGSGPTRLDALRCAARVALDHC